MIDIASLRKYSLFGGLLPEQIERILPLLGRAEASVGEEIIREGQCNDRIYFLLEGAVEVEKAGHRIIELGEGEIFGEMELLDVMPSVATIRALRPTALAVITNRAVHEIFRIDPAIFALIMMNLARDLSRRLRRMDELLTSGAAAPSLAAPR